MIIETFTLPIISYELYRISKELRNTAEIEIGVVSIKEYPLSRIRKIEKLPTQTKISQSYPHFCLIIKNGGSVPAKYVKLHLEFTDQKPTFNTSASLPIESLASPVIEIFNSTSLNVFNKENNVDFIFQGGADWILRPHDIEKFDFFISTSIGSRDPNQQHERPYPCICTFTCTIWSEDLRNPISQIINVEIEKSVQV